MSRFERLNKSERQALVSSVRSGEYNLFLGAGISLDSVNGESANLPSGESLRARLCEVTGLKPTTTLQRVASALSREQIESELTLRFQRCVAGPSTVNIPKFLWKRIFTLNIDDVLEEAYKRPGNIQRPEFRHFLDSYSEVRSLESVPVIHLHGRVKQPDRGYVFDRNAYASIMATDNAWMTVLADVMPSEPFFVIGTSLDEVDVSFYLAKRTADSTRTDRGPSFLIEPFPDALTERECEKHGLYLYKGTAEEFFKDLNDLVPNRACAYDLVPQGTQELFPEEAPRPLVLSFSDDFERVPVDAPIREEGLRFAGGHPPTWSDLARHWDVGRALSARLRPMVDAMLKRALPERAVVLLESPGTGKSTVLRRVAYDFAAQGIVTLIASSISRLDPISTAEALSFIEGPILIVVDNIADQAPQIRAIIESSRRNDFIVLAADRDYRSRHLASAFGDLPYRVIDGLKLTEAEAHQLVTSYISRGAAGVKKATETPAAFARSLIKEPIAVAGCIIKNDMTPLNNIVSYSYEAARKNEKIRYLCSTIAQYCFSSGARYEIIRGVAEPSRWKEQLQGVHPLPLDYYDDRGEFVIPLNSVLAERTLAIAPPEDVLLAFQRLAIGLAPRVTRKTIKLRTPEARLAGRLFDYDDVVEKFLGDSASVFYKSVQKSWQWNSRFWEQVSLFKLSAYRRTKDYSLLQEAVQHARHAVAIETHPHPMTTLGKVLLAQMGQGGSSINTIYSEAHHMLAGAIDKEQAESRVSIHAYITLFRGANYLIEAGKHPLETEIKELKSLLYSAYTYFPRDRELMEVAQRLEGAL